MRILGILLAASLLAGCTVQRVAEYRGGQVYPGSSGAVRRVKGIDIWTSGEPNRPYRIIALIDDERAAGDVMFREGSIARRVKRLGGDGAIFQTAGKEVSGAVAQPIFGGAVATTIYRAQSRYAVIRYAEPVPSR